MQWPIFTFGQRFFFPSKSFHIPNWMWKFLKIKIYYVKNSTKLWMDVFFAIFLYLFLLPSLISKLKQFPLYTQHFLTSNMHVLIVFWQTSFMGKLSLVHKKKKHKVSKGWVWQMRKRVRTILFVCTSCT